MATNISERIDLSREKLYKLMYSESLDSKQIIAFSQELDKLILEFIKEKP